MRITGDQVERREGPSRNASNVADGPVMTMATNYGVDEISELAQYCADQD